jgi:thioesterase domain-containing protein
MSLSISEFHLQVFRLGVRISIQDSQFIIRIPDELPDELRHEMRSRHDELELYIRRLLGVAPSSQSGAEKEFAGKLSKVKFDRTCLVPIKPGDPSSALFVTHSLSGMVAPAELLSRLLPADRGVFGFQALGLTTRNQPLSSIEEMAAYYVGQMKLVNPTGPYLLCGWSLGGYVAFEMARQILMTGGKVSFLGIVDSEIPITTLSERTRWLFFTTYVSQDERFSNAALDDKDNNFWQLTDDEKLWLLLKIAQSNEKSIFRKCTDIQFIGRHFRYFNAACDAQAKYEPGPYSDPCTFFEAQEGDRVSARGWAELVKGPLDVIPVPGDHFSVMERAANRGVLAEKLVGEIERQANCTVSSPSTGMVGSVDEIARA